MHTPFYLRIIFPLIPVFAILLSCGKPSPIDQFHARDKGLKSRLQMQGGFSNAFVLEDTISGHKCIGWYAAFLPVRKERFNKNTCDSLYSEIKQTIGNVLCKEIYVVLTNKFTGRRAMLKYDFRTAIDSFYHLPPDGVIKFDIDETHYDHHRAIAFAE